MRALLTGITTILLVLINTLALIGPMLLIALLKLVLPGQALKDACSRAVMGIAEAWAENCKRIFALLTPTRWDIRGGDGLRNDTSYLVVSNHQSWVDIPALVQAFNRKAPYFKFFLKQELIWVPVIGLCWWALDFPFMKRYSKAYLAKHPEKKGKDLETTRRTCDKFRHNPVGIFNFLEGTRFTPAKHAQQASPFRYLLKPKAGGVAFVLDAMGDQLEALLNITIHYPGGNPSFWALMAGQVGEVVVRIEALPIPAGFLGRSYDQDEAYRKDFQLWVNQLWERKDAELAALHQSHPPRS